MVSFNTFDSSSQMKTLTARPGQDHGCTKSSRQRVERPIPSSSPVTEDLEVSSRRESKKCKIRSTLTPTWCLHGRKGRRRVSSFQSLNPYSSMVVPKTILYLDPDSKGTKEDKVQVEKNRWRKRHWSPRPGLHLHPLCRLGYDRLVEIINVLQFRDII